MAATIAATAAGAATMHRFGVSQTTGSGGAQTALQSTASGSALQGEVAASSNTGIKLPFGVLGEYDASGSTFGVGVIGVSTTGYAVAGESLSNNNPSILAFPGGTGIGLEATNAANSTSPPIYAEAKGVATSIVGAVTETREQTTGVLGEDLTTVGNFNVGVLGTTMNGAYGVEGTAGDNGVGGVYGAATNGLGTAGVSDSGDGVYAYSSSGLALEADAFSPVVVRAVDYNSSGIGIQSSASFIGFQTTNDSGHLPTYGGAMTGTAVGVQGSESLASGYPMELYGGSNGQTLITYVTNAGDLYVHGTMHTFSEARGGGEIDTFVPRSSSPTVEDVGTGHLSNGVASIAIDPAMVRSLDQSRAYHVFLTPEGDTKGLFVAQKTSQGFVVRETQGGRGTFDFDYRIVGSVDGHANERMGLVAKRPSRSEEMAASSEASRVTPRRKFDLTHLMFPNISAKKAAYLAAHPNVGTFKPYIAPPIVDPMKGTRVAR